MQLRLLSIVPALLLAACSSAAPVPQPAESEPAALEKPVMGPERRILAFGDSLFAGYNVAREDSYPAKLEASLRARGINARVTNAGVSGDTTAAGLQRFTFTLDAQERPPELVVLELGGNDLLRGLSPEQTRANLSAMLDELKRRKIPVILMGMRAPPNLGADYVAEFDSLYPELAREYDVALVPFFLEAIYDKPEYIQPDRIHPTERGIEELVASTADDVAEALPPAQRS
jgi:acyl-CoA thioesterase-1